MSSSFQNMMAISVASLSKLAAETWSANMVCNVIVNESTVGQISKNFSWTLSDDRPLFSPYVSRAARPHYGV